MKKALLVLAVLVAVSTAACADQPTQPPVRDEGAYTDSYLARTGQFSTAQDAWDEGYRQGQDNKAHPSAPAAAAPPAATATGDVSTSDDADQPRGGNDLPCSNAPTCADAGNTYSYGKDVPLADALKEIAPKGWNVTVPPEAANSNVTWNSGLGRPWVTVAQAVAHEAGFYLGVNPAMRSVSVAESQDSANRLCSGEEEWQIIAGKSLRENLRAWAVKAELSPDDFDWEATREDGTPVDYPITHSASFIGTFNGPDSVVKQVLDLYTHAQYPLTYQFTDNHVLLITVIRRAAPTAPASMD
jgi:hypothetical protein